MGLNKWSFLYLAAAAALAGSLCFPLHVHASDGSYTVGKTVILYSYDTHGDENEYKAISQHKKELENSGYDVILVDAGGFFDGDGDSLKIWNIYGYDIAMPSGSDFSQGIDVFAQGMRTSRTYLVCSNIVKNGRYLYKPRRIITSTSGKRIGFIGVSSAKDVPEGYGVLEGDELERALQEDIKALRQGGVDVIFMIGSGEERLQAVDDKVDSEPYAEVSENSAISEKTEISENSIVSENAVENDNVSVSENSANTEYKEEENVVVSENKTTTASLYEVMKGDSLWKISYKIYGKQLKNRWEEIFNLNKNKIANQEIIYSGQEFELPQ